MNGCDWLFRIASPPQDIDIGSGNWANTTWSLGRVWMLCWSTKRAKKHLLWFARSTSGAPRVSFQSLTHPSLIHLDTGDWRKKLESQPGAVLATEMKNNNCKLARWTAQAVMAGAKFMKIAYIARNNQRNNRVNIFNNSSVSSDQSHYKATEIMTIYLQWLYPYRSSPLSFQGVVER